MTIALSDADGDQLVRELTSEGWRVCRLRRSTSKESFLREIAEALEFPSWFGHNLDALWDCLTDLTEPTALVWTDWQPFAVHQRKDWSTLLGLLGERAEERPSFSVHLLR